MIPLLRRGVRRLTLQCNGSGFARPLSAPTVSITRIMGKPVRRQLSMYLPLDQAAAIEDVRIVVDPIQHLLIPAHVTLCRDEELEDLSGIETRLQASALGHVDLGFGRPQAFHGHGILMECVSGLESFRALREILLGSIEISSHQPHLTLAHPRNPKAVGNSLANTDSISTPFHVRFSQIALIEQEGAAPWKFVREYPLEFEQSL